MRYLCVHCDEKFELEPGAEPRCPKCLRLHGLRPLANSETATGQPKSSKRGARAFAFVVVIALVGAGGYLLWQRSETIDPAKLATTPLSARQLSRQLAAAQVDAGTLAQLFEPNAAIERAAERAASGQSGAEAKMRAVVKALRARAASGAFSAWSLADPRVGPVRAPAQTLQAIAKDGAHEQLYPLEVAALAISELRALGVPAMLTEVYAWPGERTPLDPSGRFGYFAVALPNATGQAAHVLDPYGGRAELPSCTDCALLSDVQAVGVALGLRASQRLAANEEPSAALHDADAAVKLVPGSPSVRTARGTVLLANAASDLGQSELEAAAQLRPDAPRRNNLAMVYLALGDGERAAREVAQVLEQQPDFALGHATLAEIHLARGERELARAELEKADALDPKLSSLALTWAQFYASAGQNDQAIAYGQRAVAARPNDPQAHLVLGRIERQAGHYDEMRREAQRVLALVPQSMSERTRELLRNVLGPTALEPVEPSDTAAAASAPPQAASPTDSPRLQLGGAPTGVAPSDGTLKAGGGPTRLRLSEPGQGLKLRSP